MSIDYTKGAWVISNLEIDPDISVKGLGLCLAVISEKTGNPVKVAYINTNRPQAKVAADATLMGIAPDMYEVIRRVANGENMQEKALELIESINKSATGKKSCEI